nr:keratinocyte proline-rich protein-like [Dermacentor andersoni]
MLLEAVTPNQVADVRVNARKNVLAIDTVHETVLQTLSKLTEHGGKKVRSYIPLDSDTTTGVIYDVDVSISSADLPILVKPAANGFAITRTSRLGESRCMKLIFKGQSLPSHDEVGHFRHPIRSFIRRPLQCCNCMRLGHISAVCENMRACSRCAEPHAADSCIATVLKCPNCIGSHDATSKDCPKMKKEWEVFKQMARARLSCQEAVVAVRKRRSKHCQTSKNTDASLKSMPQPTTPPPLPPRPGGVEFEVAPHNTNTEAWPMLPKWQPPPQMKPQPKKWPGPQPMAQLKPQLKPQQEPQPKPQPKPRPMPQPEP